MRTRPEAREEAKARFKAFQAAMKDLCDQHGFDVRALVEDSNGLTEGVIEAKVRVDGHLFVYDLGGLE